MRGVFRREVTQARRFAMVGLFTNASLYLLFLVSVWVGLPPIGVSAFCYLLGVALSYVLNRRWGFQSLASHRDDLPKFLFAYVAGLGMTLISMSILVAPLGPAMAQLVTIGLAAGTIFATLRLLGFGEPQAGRSAVRKMKAKS